jgi:hypothetical protein
MRKVLFVAVYFLFVTFANAILKLSASEPSPPWFVLLQLAGNLCGFVGVLAYTGLMRTTPLHIAFPLTQGFAVLGVQVVASALVAGIALVSL